jgi:DNA-binding YbaB/EbfC family protein
MKGGIGQLMKQAQEMQASMERAQQELADTVVVGEAGGGMVKVHMTCKHEVRNIEIDDSLIGDDRDMLEDLIAAACNAAAARVARTTQEKFAGMTAGLNLPAGMKLPF